MPKYKKKPVVIEAVQLGVDALPDWFMDALSSNTIITHGCYAQPIESASIETLEGTMTANRGDYIIKGVQGELYPCKPDIFQQTYELVEEA